MAYEAYYTINTGKRFKEQPGEGWFDFGNPTSRNALWLRAKFRFSKDIKDYLAYMFPTKTPHGREIAERIKGSFLEKYLLKKESFSHDANRGTSYGESYINEERTKQLKIFCKKRNGFELVAHKDIALDKVKLDFLDLDALNEAIITGKF